MDLKISQLTSWTPDDNSLIPYVDLVTWETKKATKTELKWDKWDTWDAATLNVWTTTTWDAWTEALVTNVWTTSAAVFNFVIPRWEAWPQWLPWDTWATWNGIASIVRTSWDWSPWTTDTYTITYTDTTTTTFDVYNWADWEWAWDVTWPASSTDNAVARFDSTTWKIIQNSSVTIDDSWNISANNISWTNTWDVTLAWTPDYLTITNQEITLNSVDLANDVTWTLPIANWWTWSATQNFVDLSSNQTINWLKTFGSFALTPSSAPTSDYQVANKKYVDDNAWWSSSAPLFAIDIAWTQVVGQVYTFVCNWAITAWTFRASLETLCTWADFIIKLYKNWVEDASITIATTASATNWLYQATDTSFVSWSYVAWDVLTVSITQVWSVVAWAWLLFSLYE